MTCFTDWYTKQETFRFLAHVWDVDAAKRILNERVQRGRPAREGVLRVADVAPLLQRVSLSENGTVRSMTMGVGVDWDEAARPSVDLTVPVVLAWSRPARGRKAVERARTALELARSLVPSTAPHSNLESA